MSSDAEPGTTEAHDSGEPVAWLTGAESRDPLGRRALREALRAMANAEPMAGHPLAALPMVEAFRRSRGYPDTEEGRSVALRGVLRQGIAGLRPGSGEPDYLDSAWYPYLILQEQFLRKVAVEVLADQMGLSRSSYFREQRRALDALAEALRAQHEETLAAPVARPATPRHNLPASLTPFIGRGAELDRIAAFLADPGCRFLSLVGIGGSGKTRLAIEAARAAVPRYRDGVFFISLSAVKVVEPAPADLEELLAVELLATLQRIFLGASALRGEAIPGLLESLRDKETLLILDNFEPWVSAAELIPKMLQASPGVRLITTSRERLRVAGEQVMDVHGLPLPAEPEDEAIVRSDAVQLFLQSARGAQAQFALSGENLAHIAAICQLLDGHPLGIELAAGWTRALTPGEVRVALEADVGFLTSPRRDIPERQRSLSAILAYSWGGLSAFTATHAARLAVFQNGFTLEAARGVTSITPVMLAELVDRSLLSLADRGRYVLHPLLQQYAAQRLTEQPADEESARDRHAAYYLELLERWGTEIHGVRTREALDALNPELGNVRAAWQRACETRQLALLSRSENALTKYYLTVGLFAEGERAFRTAIDSVREPAGHAQPARLLALLLLTRAQCLIELGQFAAAVETALEALALGQADNDDDLQARSHAALGSSYASRGEHPVARQHLEQAVELADALGLSGVGATARYTLGTMARNESHWELSIELHEAGLRLSRQAGDLRGESVALVNIGGNHGHLGHLARARDTLRQALDLGRTLGEVLIQITALANLGNVDTSIGEFTAAYAQFRQAHTMYREMGHVYGQLAMLVNLSLALNALGDFEAALDHSQQGIRLASERPGHAVLEGHLCTTKGIALAALQDYPAATQAYETALAIFERIQLPHLGSDARAGLAAVELAQGRSQQARDRILPILGDLSAEALSAVLDSALEPFGTLLICCRALRGAGDPRAADLLRAAHALLLDRADRVGDEALRQAFLKKAPYNRALMAEYTALVGRAA